MRRTPQEFAGRHQHAAGKRLLNPVDTDMLLIAVTPTGLGWEIIHN